MESRSDNNFACWIKQPEHQHEYSSEKCLKCAIGLDSGSVDRNQLENEYWRYCESWRVYAEIENEKRIKSNYRKINDQYYAFCYFCQAIIKGRRKNKRPLHRNLVNFWTEDKLDDRLICSECLKKKKIIKELNITKRRKQLLYNYRNREII
jgi:hypothetical protein